LSEISDGPSLERKTDRSIVVLVLFKLDMNDEQRLEDQEPIIARESPLVNLLLSP